MPCPALPDVEDYVVPLRRRVTKVAQALLLEKREHKLEREQVEHLRLVREVVPPEWPWQKRVVPVLKWPRLEVDAHQVAKMRPLPELVRKVMVCHKTVRRLGGIER